MPDQTTGFNFMKSGHAVILGTFCTAALLGGIWVINSGDSTSELLKTSVNTTQFLLSETIDNTDISNEEERSFNELYNNAVAFKTNRQHTQSTSSNTLNISNLSKPNLPKGFNAQWQQLTLDDSVVLHALVKPFKLKETTDQLGHEYFYYDAYLFEQMAQQVNSDSLKSALHALAANTKQMGDTIAQADMIKFDGAPTEDMTHLHVRSQMMFHLNGLNESAFHLVDKTSQGKILKEKQPQLNQIGPVLSQFMTLNQTLLSNAALSEYPQVKALLRQEGHRLKQLAENIHIHWETTFHCSSNNQCHNRAINMKIYPRQNLSEFKMSDYAELLALKENTPLEISVPSALIAKNLNPTSFP